MRIVRVELQNIKSYRDAVIDLQRGVTAVRGHNGAGKSTLVEAIGWALFDTLPYKQDLFVREGERTGRVTVRFISPRDSREYEAVRRCGTGATWFIHDPETGLRHESTADIHDFLRAQFQIDSSISLEDLFKSAIGVPQGSLTADFLLSTAPRRKRFDALLQVEDYGKAWSNLSTTVSHLKERRAAQEAEIKALEREVELLDEARALLDEAQTRTGALEADRERYEREAEQVEARRQALLQAQAEVMRRAGAAETAAARLEGARQRLASAGALLAEARLAAETVAAARAGHERYIHAEREQAGARLRQRQRDELLKREASAATREASASAEDRALRQRLTAVEQAEREIVALQSDVARQTELERARDTARRESETLRDASEGARKATAALTALTASITQLEREVASVEAARAEAEARPARQRAVDSLQAAAAVRAQRESRRGAIASERAANTKRRKDAATEAAKEQDRVTRIENVRADVERLPGLEEVEASAKAAVDGAQARLAQTRLSRQQAGAGNCPFLTEPCLNIQKRGENSLRAYFDKRIAQEERALAPLQAALAEAMEVATSVRTKSQYYARLDEYRDRLAKAEAALADCDATAQRLDVEEAEIAADLKRAGDTKALAEAQRLLKASEEADRLLATLASVRRDLDDRRERSERDTAERDRLAALAAGLASAPAALRAAEAELVALGDPRERNTRLLARAAERGEIEAALAATTKTLAALATERAGLADALAPYATLDAELAALDKTLTDAREAHTHYMRHETSAAQLPARAADRDTAAAESTTAESADAAARKALATARARFDDDELAAASKRAGELSDARGQNREELRATRARIATLEGELERGKQRIAALEAARVERDDLAATETMLQQFREILKEAGPQVTRALLSQISAHANTIFGDIMGDRAGTLTWENDYEITLRRGGASRTFAQLSGGEQMSAALAVRLALLRKLTRLDMAFFDEPTQNMDGERRSALAEQLRRVRGFDQLLVISHDDTFEQGLDGVIHLEKRDGETRVAEGEDVFGADAPLEVGDLSALAI